MPTIQEMKTLKDTVERMLTAGNDALGKIDRIIAAMEAQESHREPTPRSYEYFSNLSVPFSYFKGKKPTGIIFPNGERKTLGTWRQVVVELMKDCISDPIRKTKLLNLRGLASGRNRVLIDREPSRMRGPVQIEPELYIECHYDTQVLLHVAIDLLLRNADYDCSQIKVALKTID